jgi:phenylacetate-coenzyme A ligase PaaK-like adenylate-forming protein
MTLAGALRARLYERELRERRAAVAALPNPAEREAIQIEALNREWARVTSECPFYARLREGRRLPRAFASLGEFAERVPVTSREAVQREGAGMASRARRADAVRMTGGSTAQPLRFPAWSSETAFTRYDRWIARGWYGITPASRLFLLWGHSHLLGAGVAGWVRARRLELADRLVGYTRFSAYDLRPEAMRRAGDALLRFRPDYLVGYSVALHVLARVNEDRARELGALGVQAAFATGEAFPSEEGPKRLEGLFGCPVGMEYGSVETDIIAHTHPEGGYRAFWRSYLIEALGAEERRRVVTSLYPRAFPLVRYDMGDEIELEAGADPGRGVASFSRVAGRCNDVVPLRGGALVHSELFSHAVRPCTAVRGFQVVVGSDALRIRYTAERELGAADATAVRDRLARIHPELADVELERVDDLEHTVAGKTRMVVRAP